MSEHDGDRLAQLLVIDLHSLPEATHTDIDRRTQDEVHAERARVALLAGPSPQLNLSRRWMDLCPECSIRVREFAYQESDRKEQEKFPTYEEVWERAREREFHEDDGQGS